MNTAAFVIIGEACKQLPQYVKDDNPSVPWRGIAGMRDVLVHQYAGINLKALWDAVKNNVPELKKAVEKMVEPSGGFKALREKAERYAARMKQRDLKSMERASSKSRLTPKEADEFSDKVSASAARKFMKLKRKR